jgi:hypothetical protein
MPPFLATWTYRCLPTFYFTQTFFFWNTLFCLTWQTTRRRLKPKIHCRRWKGEKKIDHKPHASTELKQQTTENPTQLDIQAICSIQIQTIRGGNQKSLSKKSVNQYYLFIANC